MPWRSTKPITERVVPQSDERFLDALSSQVSSSQYKFAMELRRLIAAFAGVDSNLVREDATFADLDIGSADSIDEIDFTLRLQTLFDVPLSQRELVQIPSPDMTRGLTIGVFIRAVCAVLTARAGS
jgi:hypothetical protein